MNLYKKIIFYIRIFQGFSREGAIEWNENRKTYKKLAKYLATPKTYQLYKDYIKLTPLSGKYNKLVCDRLSLRYIFHDCKKYFLSYYFKIVKRNGYSKIISLDNDIGQEVNKKKIFLKLAQEKFLMTMPAIHKKDSVTNFITFTNETIYQNGNPISESQFYQLIDQTSDMHLICGFRELGLIQNEEKNNKLLKLSTIVINENGNDPKVVMSFLYKTRCPNSNQHILSPRFCVASDMDHEGAERTFGFWNSIKAASIQIALKLRELKMIEIQWVVSNSNFKCCNICSYPTLPYDFVQNTVLAQYIKEEKHRQKKSETIRRRVFHLCKEFYIDIASAKGFLGFMLKNWRRDLIKDWIRNRVPIKDKLWAHRNGFLSFRIKQYNLTDENKRDFLSDYDYRKLRPINNELVTWVYDKVSMRYILDKFSAYLPKYYFHLDERYGIQRIIRMPDLSASIDASIDGIVKVLKMTSCLIVKPSEGSHGVGVMKLLYKESLYYINNQEVSEIFLRSMLENLKGSYIVTEYINMHPYLKSIYDKTTYTVRLMVINKYGNKPWIANAYLRIATNKTGVTDNISDGGICAEIDIQTGQMYYPECIINHEIIACSVHPDSGMAIEGIVPNWGKIKAGILEISQYIFPLEYLGFDVVITEDSFTILEINTHQDLHRYPYYDKKIHEYFTSKL